MTVVLVVAMLAAGPASTYENRYSDWARAECRMSRGDGDWSASEARDTERCVARRFAGVSPLKMLRVGGCESGHHARAVSDGGRYRGLYQHDRTRWAARIHWTVAALRREFSRPIARGIFNARTNAGVTAVMVHRSGWGAWSCA